MNYEQFVSALTGCVETELDGGAVVETRTVLKNNGVSARGIVIRNPHGEVAPVIYLDDFYELYREGETLEEIAKKILLVFRECPEPQGWDYREILEFDSVRGKISYKLVNAEKNRELLKEVPHLPLLDFAIVFYLMISEGEFQNCSVLIKNDHMNLWKIPISVLYQTAKENAPKLCPCVLRPLSELLGVPEEVIPEAPVLILTNEQGVNGASALLYPHIPEDIYRTAGGCYYLLPSSVHEFLVVPESAGISAKELSQMVKDINEAEVAPEDVLSDHIYYFDGEIITKM